jgi:hypothetical protein
MYVSYFFLFLYLVYLDKSKKRYLSYFFLCIILYKKHSTIKCQQKCKFVRAEDAEEKYPDDSGDSRGCHGDSRGGAG